MMGIGTWVPGNKLSIIGTTYYSSNVGIGTIKTSSLITVGGSCATSAQGQGVCWGTNSAGITWLGYCTAGTWPNCSTCTCC